jgi:hypothetical protein
MNSEIPVAANSGTLLLGNTLFRCHVLNDHRRLISVPDFMGAMEVPPARRHVFLQYLESLASHPVSTSERLRRTVEKLKSPILFRFNQNVSYGYDAETFVDFCSYLLELRRLGTPLSDEEKTRADISERIIISIANVGLVALIDEATGFQSLRPRDALQVLLDKYLRRELAAWAKTFPDEFYIELFRLKGWEWKGMKINRPQVVGHYTRDIVYERLAPGVLEELEKRNPTGSDGQRNTRHHQWLTQDVGHPALAQHLHAILGLMRASSSWQSFRRILDRAFPKRGSTFELPLDIEEDYDDQ